jgi:hypothetical protein
MLPGYDDGEEGAGLDACDTCGTPVGDSDAHCSEHPVLGRIRLCPACLTY